MSDHERRYHFELIFGHAIWPFLLVAIALGLIFGAGPQTFYRQIRWRKWRHKLGLWFPIWKPYLSWDGFFASLKPHSIVAVFFEDTASPGTHANSNTHTRRVLVGQVAGRSGGPDEESALTLRNADWIEIPVKKEGYWSTKRLGKLDWEEVIERWEPGRDLVHISRDTTIARIEAPPSSVEHHGDPVNHSAQAFFLLLVSAGLFVISWSSQLTYGFYEHFAYPFVASVYHLVGIGSLFASIGTSSFAVCLPRKDYNHNGSAGWVISPVPYSFATILFVFQLVLFAGIVYRAAMHENVTLASFLVITFGVILVFVVNSAIIVIRKESAEE